MKKSILLLTILITSLSIGQNTFPSTGSVGIGVTNPRSNLEVTDWTTALSIGSTKNTEAMIDNEVLGAINFYKHYNIGYAASIKLLQAGDGNQYSPAHLAFYTTSGGNVFTTTPEERMRITSLGDVGIGTTNPDSKLAVNGTIHSKEVKVDLNVPAPDYVFAKDYKLRTLQEVEKFVNQNSHLPEIPSAQEFEKNGIQLAEMNMALLKKVEELTLYIIKMEKNQAELEKRILNIEEK
ncbi:hypothetical protein [Flavobacterium seoulense]|uniref:Peptidase S74 domain-containing protein n=1 Tax=Flavobacterium seoulense TaxID=1492738 RepID=A0A066WQ68_9FLAO|nr:hypothetical protein [Flavobacterium seoulense]KDN54718.1 hypothetical protein FEM21_22320 [Flavobacterium seoulense]